MGCCFGFGMEEEKPCKNKMNLELIGVSHEISISIEYQCPIEKSFYLIK